MSDRVLLTLLPRQHVLHRAGLTHQALQLQHRQCRGDHSDRQVALAAQIVDPSVFGGYDEMSARSYPDYPGGTSEQRWHRDLLRRAMEDEGFTVYEAEWWHFDFRGWKKYPISNRTFEQLDADRQHKEAKP